MPAIAPTAILALGASKTVLDFAGQRAAANAAERQGEYEQQLYGVNAEMAKAQAVDAIARGRESEQKHLRAVRQIVGASRVKAAASGVDMDSGSVAAVRRETDLVSEQDVLRIRNNAAREAWGYQVEAASSTMRGELAYRAGRNAARALRNSSSGTLISGALDTYGQYRIAKGD